ncbi:MAG: PD-(D/E)XK nuclease family protein, partial [Planctomycetaceae bacterium]
IGRFFDTIYSDAAAEHPTRPTDEGEPPTPAVIEQRSVVDRAERRAQIALLAARRKLASLSELGPTLDTPMPAAAALDLIAGRLLGLRVSDAARDEAIQISGWLDLALDESPALIVIGFNHPYVPDSVTADPFLPGSLRSRLGMADNERRLARDIYVTQLILATRPHARFVVGRRGADGSPTPPTRLLAASKPADVARRLIRLLDSDATNRRRQSAPPMPRLWDGGADRTGLPIPKLVPKEPIRSLSVTSFSAYLACPYRFFLRHELQLKPIDDASRELAANQFGDLIHQSLEWFGNSPEKDETDVERIEEALLDALDRFAADHLGAAPTPAVRLQVEQARRRLQHVAKAQAERRQAGWSIWKVEASVGPHNQAGIDVDGRRMGIRGRFDRIDRHPSGAWAILDYKTHGFPPRKKHLKKSPSGGYRWIDLQLPIYRMMIPYLVGQEVDPGTVALGYFNIGDKGSETRINEADFSEAEFVQAEEVIRDCIRRIWDGDFAPSEEPVMFDDYAMILQTGILQSEIADDWLEPEPA